MDKNSKRNEFLLDVFRNKINSEEELLFFILSESMKKTASSAGYIAVIKNNQKVVERILRIPSSSAECAMPEENIPVSETSFIKKCISEKNILLSSFKSDSTHSIEYNSDILKERHIEIPVFNGDIIAGVLGLADGNYSDDNIFQLLMLVNGIYQVGKNAVSRKKQGLLEAIIESTGEAFINVSLNSIIASWNPGAEVLFGYRDEEVLGKDFSLLSVSDIPDEFPIIIDTVKMGGTVNNHETIRMKKDGTRVDVSLSAAPVKNPDGSIDSLSIICRDITKERYYRKQLKTSEEKYRAIFENTGTGTLIIGEDGTIKLINREFEILSGFSKDEVEGKKKIFDFIPQSERDKIISFHQNRRGIGTAPPRNYEFHLMNKNKEVMDIFITVEIIPGTKDSVASFMDITEIKKLQTRVIDICEKDRRQMGHDLHDGLMKNLNAIQHISFEMINSGKGCESLEQLERIRQLSEASVTQTENLVNGLKPVARAGDLREVVGKLVDMIRKVYEVEIDFEFSRDVEISDEFLANNLYFIIQQAVLNSLRFSEPEKILIALEKDGEWCNLIIDDDGISIKKKQMDKSGVSFKIMEYRATSIGGMIDTKHLAEGGNRTLCRFRNDGIATPLLVKRKIKVPDQKQKKILVIDGHPIIRHGIVQLVEDEEGLAICGEAEKSEETLRIIEKIKPDLALMIFSHDGGIGVELVKAIRTRYKKVPVLVLSVNDEAVYGEMFVRAGAGGFVLLKDGLEDIIEAIKDVLKGKTFISKSIREIIFTRLFDSKNSEEGTPLDRLTKREFEIFQHIGHGLGPKEIAEKLCLSSKTVETYRERIKEKLNIGSASELSQFAIRYVFHPDIKK